MIYFFLLCIMAASFLSILVFLYFQNSLNLSSSLHFYNSLSYLPSENSLSISWMFLLFFCIFLTCSVMHIFHVFEALCCKSLTTACWDNIADIHSLKHTMLILAYNSEVSVHGQLAPRQNHGRKVSFYLLAARRQSLERFAKGYTTSFKGLPPVTHFLQGDPTFQQPLDLCTHLWMNLFMRLRFSGSTRQKTHL